MKSFFQFFLVLGIATAGFLLLICIFPAGSAAQTATPDSILRNTLVRLPIADSDAMYILAVITDRATEAALSASHKRALASGHVVDSVKVYANQLVSTYAILGQQPYGEARYVLTRLEPIILSLLPAYPPELTAAILLIRTRNQRPYLDGIHRGTDKANAINKASDNN